MEMLTEIFHYFGRKTYLRFLAVLFSQSITKGGYVFFYVFISALAKATVVVHLRVGEASGVHFNGEPSC